MHSELAPKTLFFSGKIEKNDSLELRKALRLHQVNLIVLASSGGSIFEGLQMAGIIHDKKLTTYVPNKGRCASACSFMFFAGDKRKVRGRLGVHQFYSKKGSENAQREKVEKGVQFTVSEIIGFLNEFGTPAWVYERMFQQADMYYFKRGELEKLETEIDAKLKISLDTAEAFISELRAAIAH